MILGILLKIEQSCARENICMKANAYSPLGRKWKLKKKKEGRKETYARVRPQSNSGGLHRNPFEFPFVTDPIGISRGVTVPEGTRPRNDGLVLRRIVEVDALWNRRGETNSNQKLCLYRRRDMSSLSLSQKKRLTGKSKFDHGFHTTFAVRSETRVRTLPYFIFHNSFLSKFHGELRAILTWWLTVTLGMLSTFEPLTILPFLMQGWDQFVIKKLNDFVIFNAFLHSYLWHSYLSTTFTCSLSLSNQHLTFIQLTSGGGTALDAHFISIALPSSAKMTSPWEGSVMVGGTGRGILLLFAHIRWSFFLYYSKWQPGETHSNALMRIASIT